MLEHVRATSRVTYTHLRQGRPIGVREGAFVVGYEKEFHPQEIVNRPKQTALVASALEKAFGQKLRFAYELVAPVSPSDQASPAPDEVAHKPQTPDELVVHGLGAEMIEEMDG